MAIQAVDTSQVWEYVCKRERDAQDPHPTVWKLGVIDGRIMKYIKDAVTSFDGTEQAKGTEQAQTTVKTGNLLWLLVKYGLRGWSNFLDLRGQPIAESFDTIPHGKQSYQAVKDDVLGLMHPDVLSELANEIANHNSLKEIQKHPLGS